MRLDHYLVEKGLYPTREQAKRAILAGEVEIKGRTDALKPGEQVGRSAPEVHIRARPPYVSRSGEKLAGALEAWGLEVTGMRALDVGSSTGGFTDCLLQKGASEVIALDVGKGQLHWRLRNDPRVTVMEGVNARYLRLSDLPFKPDLAVIDVSFISLLLVLKPLAEVLERGEIVLALVKPQFEAGRSQVGKGGIVRDPEVHIEVLEKTRAAARETGFFAHRAAAASPRGRDGNREFVLLLVKGVEPETETDLASVCEEG